MNEEPVQRRDAARPNLATGTKEKLVSLQKLIPNYESTNHL